MLASSLESWGDARYQEGLEHGLYAAELIVGWLTEQPDTKRQAKVRQWAERAIAKARAGGT